MDNQSRITDALSSLLQRRNGDAFVIFEEKRSRKFVQFAGSVHDELLLDLPCQTLSPAEIERAKSLFETLGYSGPETYPLYTDPSMRTVAGIQTTFQMELGHDVEQAAKITLAIFENVYGYSSDFQLVIEEG